MRLTPELPDVEKKTFNLRITPNVGQEEIIATVPSMLKGSIRNRILLYLAINQSNTNTISSIAKGIRSTNGRVSQEIVDLVSEGTVRSIRSNDSQTTFILEK